MQPDSVNSSPTGKAQALSDTVSYAPDSLWLLYIRLIGIATCVFVACATPLHEIGCKLRSEALHWEAATLLMVLASVLTIALFTGGRRQTPSGPRNQTATFSFQPIEPDKPTMAAESNSQVEPLDELLGEPSNEPLETPAPRPAWTRHVVAATLLAGFLIYMIVVPVLGMLIKALSATDPQSYTLTDMTPSETIRLHSVSGVVMLIFLSTGASLGSFLNVVIYRLPRRRTLFWPPSACPQCLNKISGKDNVPVLSWLNLGGRCRVCAVKISARYPLVELLVAGLFVLFFYHELLSGGQNLPVRQPNSYNGIVWILLYTKWDLVGIYFFHMLLLIMLLAWGMINYDRFRVPWHAATLSTLLLTSLVVCVPTLNPLIAGWNSAVYTVPASLLVTGVGGVSGLAVGGLLEKLWRLLAGSLQTARDSQQNVLDTNKLLPTTPSAGETVEVFAANKLSVSDDLHSSESASGGEQSGSVESPKELYGAASTTPQVSGDAWLSLGAVGVVMGVEAVVVVALLSCVLAVLSWGLRSLLLRLNRFPACRNCPLSLMIFASTATLLVLWGQLPAFISLWFIERSKI